ncbi:MAG TPA: ThiF family adenylyltransferase, partial [Candidatus Bathyarchaeia archaeon]|nr:ThiF family adenylyltransferase [Candidatus Bathyarchaeia archaeon]
KRILDINPDCEIQIYQVFAHCDSLDKILMFKPQLVIDAIDALNPKVNVLKALYEREIPVISSMGAALRTDLTRIHFGDLFSAKGCPLARIVRRRLRGLGVTQGIPCVYSSEPVETKAWEMPEESSGIERGRKRNILGSMSTVTGIFGLAIAHHAIEMLIGGFGCHRPEMPKDFIKRKVIKPEKRSL